MASFIKKGESIFIPFRNGQSISDSQLKPRMYKTVQSFIKSFPGYYLGNIGVELAEYAEVVRCKDCKHWHEETGWCDHHSWFIEEDGEPCHPWESNNWKMLMEDDFCSYGERKDNA